ncbi:Hypothetical predicted protein [Mytilus galloprovincialis]|uniref:DNA-directed DNA polymerase n=1 Tax=Mytilus galloprovincialis TaxID=29158 RepID=A0A8B6FXQ2_MYTGA|nr:Hypothetical predicted protein [Mytilus galloprovincialis]
MEAKKDKILSKRGDSYKLVLTKEYKHKASIYVFNYKISLKDEKQETFTNAFDHMVDYSIKDYPNGRIKIVPIHEIIITKHKSWPIRTYNTVKKLFMDQMERLLNSAEELNLEEVIFEVTIIPNKRGKGKALKILDVINKRSIIQIKNDDTICLSRAIVTSLASNKLLKDFTDSQLKHINEGRPLQKRVAEDLHEQSGVEIKEEEKIKCVMFMNFLDVIGMDVQNVIVLKKYVKKDRNKKTMKELYNDQTKERLKTIEDYLKPNVKIHTIWECEFDQQKYPEVDPHLKPIDKRDAFYGGRTETIQLYNNLSDLKDASSDPTLNKHDKIHEIKRCKECKNIKNEKCIHSDEERVIVGTWSTIEIDKAIEKGYKLQKIYELEHFEKTSTDIFKLYVDTFMKYKQEASGCKCDPKYCKNDCKNDKECKTKIQYIIDNTAYDLDIDKVKYNSGLRFIAKICLNNLWVHFGMRDNFTQKEYCFTLEHITKIVFNEKYKDISTMILDEDIVLTEYKNKEEYSKPNPSVNESYFLENKMICHNDL